MTPALADDNPPLIPVIALPNVRQAAAAPRSSPGSPSGQKSPTKLSTKLHNSGSVTPGPYGEGIVGPVNFAGSVGGGYGRSPPPVVAAASARE